MTNDNTTYDQQGYNVQLTSDRSANGATELEGYPLDVRPDGQWPGLAGSAQVNVRPEEVKAVADWLDAQVSTTQSLPEWLATATAVSFGPSTWHEANNLKAASTEVSKAVTEYIGLVVGNMQAASGTLSTVHQTYTETEQANTATVQATNSGMGEHSGGGLSPM